MYQAQEYTLEDWVMWEACYYRNFNIRERIGPMDYQLVLPPKVKFHDVFHVSLLKKYVKYVYHVIDWSVLQVESKGDFQREPQCILQ